MIWRSTCEAVPEPDDRADVRTSLRRGRGVVGPGHGRGVGPQPLEPVVLARLVEEHVHDEIAVVEQAPTRRRETLRPRAASHRSARRSARSISSTMARTSRVLDALVITKHSTMPMISATSRTRMSSPFLSSAARAAIRALGRSSFRRRFGASGHTLPCWASWHQSVTAALRRTTTVRVRVDVACGLAFHATSAGDAASTPRSAPRSVTTALWSRSPHRRRRDRHRAGRDRGRAGSGPRRSGRGSRPARRPRPGAQVGRRQLEPRHGHPRDPPARRVPGTASLAVDDRERHARAQVVDPVPRGECRRRRRCRRRGTSSRSGAAELLRPCRSCRSGPSRSSSIRDASSPSTPSSAATTIS